MDNNILIGGAAGQGIDTLAAVLEKLLKRKGYHIFSVRDYMSRIRGGHNFIQIRFGTEEIYSHCDDLDAIIALNDETLEAHISRLRADGFAVADESTLFSSEKLHKVPLKKIARDLGNPKVSGSAAIGAVLGLFGIGTDGVEEICYEYFRQEIALLNIAAVKKGFQFQRPKESSTNNEKVIFNDEKPDNSIENAKFGNNSISNSANDGNRKDGINRLKYLLINGNEAIALGALAAGCRFYSAYPMTPSTSIMNYLASKMFDAEIVVEQAEDEIAAINMAIGASFAGARAMTGTSGGGFSLMVEALGLSGMMEMPLVVVNVQRPGPATGFPTRTEQSDLRFVISASHGEFPRLVIALRNPEDAFKQTIRAFGLAQKYRMPVILLSDQFLADTIVTTEPFDFSEAEADQLAENIHGNSRLVEKRPRVADSDEHDEYGHITESAEVRVMQMNRRLGKIPQLKEELQEPDYFGADDCEVLLVAWGSLWGSVRDAVRMLNESGEKKYGVLVFGDIWPLPVKQLKSRAQKACKLINVEQNATGQLASVITEATGLFCNGSVLKYDGRAMNSQFIYSKIKGAEQINV